MEKVKPPFDALGKTCCLTILNVCKAPFFFFKKKKDMIRLAMFYLNEIMKVCFSVWEELCKKKKKDWTLYQSVKGWYKGYVLESACTPPASLLLIDFQLASASAAAWHVDLMGWLNHCWHYNVLGFFLSQVDWRCYSPNGFFRTIFFFSFLLII